ncbi:unnamed protein product, partial [marine sediment metagenome]
MFQDVKIILTGRDGKIISAENKYSSYVFDTQYGAVASAFTLVLSDMNSRVQKGDGIQFLINNKIQFRGIIQRIGGNVGKGVRGIRLSGKDR